MTDRSRRAFLTTASLGAAAAGVAVVIPAGAAGAAEPDALASGPAHDGPFAVWVKNAKTGELAVLVGETEVVHHDRALAKKLARIAARGSQD
jgi:hypothetical protein